MRTIVLDASAWKTKLDFYNAMKKALGSPPEHGSGVNALVDSMIWGGMNTVQPPYLVRIGETKHLAKPVIDEIELAKQEIASQRAYHREQEGRDVDVTIETSP